MSKEYYWVERTEKLTPFFETAFHSPEAAKSYALEWGKDSAAFLSPEHLEVFIIEVDKETKSSDLYKENGCVVKFGSLFW